MFQGLINWLVTAVLTIFSISGLFLAAKGGSQDSYFLGLGIFVFSVIAIATVIRNSWDKAEHQ